jgi:CHAT domain-containing protein
LILHFATHGFYLPDQGASSECEIWETPLVRSGLALAGCNRSLKGELAPSAADDGFVDYGLLTAFDISGMNLTQTELVVLSACQTGLGDVAVGEGVLGLQLAFLQAGTKTLVMSLWDIKDDLTCMLMEEYYRQLLAGTPRLLALRRARQALRIHPQCAGPKDWGAFISVGNPAALKF